MSYKGMVMGGRYGYAGMHVGGLTRPLKDTTIWESGINIRNVLHSILDLKDNLPEAERRINDLRRDNIINEEQEFWLLDQLTKED